MIKNQRISLIAAVVFGLILNCLILTDYSHAQNRAVGGKVKRKAMPSKTKNRKMKEKKDKKEKDEGDENLKTYRLSPDADKTVRGPFSKTADAFGITPPIRDMPEVRDGMPPFKGEISVEDKENNETLVSQVPENSNIKPDEDLLAKKSREDNAKFQPLAMPLPALTFNGILGTELFANFGTGSMPPDTVGDVGPNHYVQATNIGVFRVFNKTGTALTAIARISTLFAGLPAGNSCRVQDNGDPIINYDPMADRWLVSQFAVSGAIDGQCMAVSVTGDPTGAWYAYFFQQPNTSFPDYPHWSVWTDGYYLATHDFNAAGTAYIEGSFWAFDRNKMLAGDPTAGFIRFSRAASYGHLPADIDGYMPPAAGTPAMFFEFQAGEYGEAGGDGLLSWEFVPNYTTPGSSTFTVKPHLPVAAFDPRDVSDFVSTRAVMEQPQPATLTTESLDGVGGRNMFRVGYRNLGTVAAPINSYVMNWNVNVSGVTPNSQATHQAGVRWEELRRSAAGAMSVFDQGTHAPDPVLGTGRNRWMGSIAQDYLGNIALGFTRSGSGAADFTDIVWAGRTGGIAAAGTMNEGEATMFASTGVQNVTNSRWGDYSAMTIDPTDDCTFWFTSEYRDSAFNGTANSNAFRWSTRVGNFKFPVCTAQPKGQITSNVTFCSTGLPVNNARVTANAGGFFRMTNVSGNVVSNIIAAPGSYTVAASKPGFTLQNPVIANVIDGNTTSANLCLIGTRLSSSAVTITSESCTVNNAADSGETLTVNLGVQVEGNNTSNLTATLQTTGGVIAASPTQNYGVVTAAAPVNRAFTFTVDPNVVPGSNITLTLALQDGAVNYGTTTYTIPVGSSVGAAQNFNYSGAVTAIPDGVAAGVNTTVVVSGVTGAIQDLNFIITGAAATPATSTGIDHTWIGDMQARLTSPAGTTVLIADRFGGLNCSIDNIFNLTLDDAAAGTIPCGTSPLTGTFRPTNPLSAFNGQNPNGTWTLNVSDVATPDSGSVRAYRLAITAATAACQGKVWTGAISSDWHDANNWSPAGVPIAGDSVVIPATGVTNNPTIGTSDVSLTNLTVVSPRILTVNAARTLTVSGTTLINGTLNVTGTTALNAAGVGLTSSNVIFNGTTSQTIPALNYNNLTINNPAGANISGSLTIAGVLTLTSGVVDTAAGSLTLTNCATSAVSGGSAASFVRGTLNRCANALGVYNYPVGTANGYSPVSSDITALGINPSSLTIRPNQGNRSGMSSTQSLQRYWTLTETGDLTTNLTFNYLDPTDIAGTEANYALYRFENSSVSPVTPFALNTAANTISANGISTFSDWTVGTLAPLAAEVSVAGRVVTSNGRGLPNGSVIFTDSHGVVYTTMTNQIGRFFIDGLPLGETYIVTVAAKRYRFTPQVLTLSENLTGLNFTATP
jgi:subtilisin-like proprotein convertase family protein